MKLKYRLFERIIEELHDNPSKIRFLQEHAELLRDYTENEIHYHADLLESNEYIATTAVFDSNNPLNPSTFLCLSAKGHRLFEVMFNADISKKVDAAIKSFGSTRENLPALTLALFSKIAESLGD